MATNEDLNHRSEEHAERADHEHPYRDRLQRGIRKQTLPTKNRVPGQADTYPGEVHAELLTRLLRRPWVFVLPLLGILVTGAPPVGVTRCGLGRHVLDPIPGLVALLLLFVHVSWPAHEGTPANMLQVREAGRVAAVNPATVRLDRAFNFTTQRVLDT
jgi:hypothetical protein